MEQRGTRARVQLIACGLWMMVGAKLLLAFPDARV